MQAAEYNTAPGSQSDYIINRFDGARALRLGLREFMRLLVEMEENWPLKAYLTRWLHGTIE